MHGAEFLRHERSLPDHRCRENIVQWHVFRSPEQAQQFASSIRLGPGQDLVGGYSRDSIGALWWVGVRVADVAAWGNRGAVNKHAQ